MIKDYVKSKERLDFSRGKKWWNWNTSRNGYSIELTTGKMLFSNTPMTTKHLQTLVKRGEKVLIEARKSECVTLLSWSWSV